MSLFLNIRLMIGLLFIYVTFFLGQVLKSWDSNLHLILTQNQAWKYSAIMKVIIVGTSQQNVKMRQFLVALLKVITLHQCSLSSIPCSLLFVGWVRWFPFLLFSIHFSQAIRFPSLAKKTKWDLICDPPISKATKSTETFSDFYNYYYCCQYCYYY